MTSVCGSWLINPTVSDSRKSRLSPGLILRTVVSSVANSISFSRTFFSVSPIQMSNILFINVDLPAFV